MVVGSRSTTHQGGRTGTTSVRPALGGGRRGRGRGRSRGRRRGDAGWPVPQLRAQLLSPFVGRRLGTFITSERADGLRDLTALVEAGTLTPVLAEVHPLAETATAVRRLLAGHVTGKPALARL